MVPLHTANRKLSDFPQCAVHFFLFSSYGTPPLSSKSHQDIVFLPLQLIAVTADILKGLDIFNQNMIAVISEYVPEPDFI